MGRSKEPTSFIGRECPSAFALGLFFICLIGFFWSGLLLKKGASSVTRELAAPPAELVHFSFGFRHAMADGLWIRSLQDFDFCEREISKHLCQGKGWLFQVLDLITNLDPRFRMAYSAGGMALTVIVSDYQGASQIFDKGVREFPKDWVLLYKAAYHALQEEKDLEKAARLMQQAAENGAPDWVYILAGRLHTDAGQRELAERILEEMKALGFDEAMQERLRQKIKAGPSEASH